MNTLLQVVFWFSAAWLVFCAAAYPALVVLRGVFRPRPIRRGDALPKVTVCIAAHNEAAAIEAKLANTAALDYPRGSLDIVVASDGSTDGTDERVRALAAPNVRLLALSRGGKNEALNAAVALARGEVLLFTDADCLLQPDALRKLVAPFADPAVGGVAGNFVYTRDGDHNRGERSYWNFDRILKHHQSRAGSITNATGQVYAIRRDLFRTIPQGMSDDFYVSAQVIAAGRRLVFEPDAVGSGPCAKSAGDEYARKVRVIAIGLRGAWRMRALWNPFRTGFYAVQVVTQKLLRRLAVLPVLAAFAASLLLWNSGPVYRLAACAQLALHGAGALGWLLRGTRLGSARVFALPLFVDITGLAALAALRKLLLSGQQDAWSPQRPQELEPAPRSLSP